MFRRLSLAVLLVAVPIFVGLQLVRPAKNASPQAFGPDSLVEHLQAPPEIRQILAVACHDCHSDSTRYPWYAEIQPAGWLLARHIASGKEALNLSSFAQLSRPAQAKRLQYMVDAMADRAMPLPSYTWIHRDAVLSDAQIAAFKAWAQTTIARLSPPGS